jgi:hypothetical protein
MNVLYRIKYPEFGIQFVLGFDDFVGVAQATRKRFTSHLEVGLLLLSYNWLECFGFSPHVEILFHYRCLLKQLVPSEPENQKHKRPPQARNQHVQKSPNSLEARCRTILLKQPALPSVTEHEIPFVLPFGRNTVRSRATRVLHRKTGWSRYLVF